MLSNLIRNCSKLRPVLRFCVTQKVALIWNMTVNDLFEDNLEIDALTDFAKIRILRKFALCEKFASGDFYFAKTRILRKFAFCENRILRKFAFCENSHFAKIRIVRKFAKFRFASQNDFDLGSHSHRFAKCFRKNFAFASLRIFKFNAKGHPCLP